jgi:beta-lactam-binding protein with PASTA domain
MAYRKQIESLVRIGLILFIFTGVAFLSAVTTIRIAIRSREVVMPDLVGKSATDAQAALDKLHLGMRVADRVYDNKIPAGSVVRQVPLPKIAVKEGQFAHVVVSLGPLSIQVPWIEGKSLRTARIELLQAGLQLGEVTSPYYERDDFLVPDGPLPDFVDHQVPRPGTQATSPRVDVLVPQAPRAMSFVMPFFLGLNEADAQRALTQAGIRAIKITPVPAIQWPAGTVIDQSPPAGARVSANGPAEIKVAQPAPGGDIHNPSN